MTNKMNKTLKMLAGVTNYMDTFRCEYLMVNSELVAHYNWNNGKLSVYNPRDTRKVARCHETLVFWDNYRNNKVFISDNVMNIIK